MAKKTTLTSGGRATVAIALLAATACGGGGSGGTSTADASKSTGDASKSTSRDMPLALTDGPTGYPAAPYGNAVGDVLPPLTWVGYEDDAADAVATTKPFAPYSMDALRRSGRRYALLHTSDFF